MRMTGGYRCDAKDTSTAWELRSCLRFEICDRKCDTSGIGRVLFAYNLISISFRYKKYIQKIILIYLYFKDVNTLIFVI